MYFLPLIEYYGTVWQDALSRMKADGEIKDDVKFLDWDAKNNLTGKLPRERERSLLIEHVSSSFELLT
jgi:hypothetical protein